MRALYSSFALVLCVKATPQAIQRYVFTPEDCSTGSFSNSASPNQNTLQLIRNVNTTECAPSLGVSSKSQDKAPLFIQSKESNLFGGLKEGISFEVWFKPLLTSTNELNTILVVGEATETTAGDNLSPCSRNGIDFLLAQRGSHLEVIFRTSETVLQACQRYNLRDDDLVTSLETGHLVHVIVSLTDKRQQIHVNGRELAALSQPFSNALDHWNPNYKLFLFNHERSTETARWRGTIYKVAMYSGSITTHDATSLLTQGLPQTPPYAASYQVEINEDAEEHPGSHDAKWYRQQAPINEAQQIELRVLSVEKEERDLLRSIGLPTPRKPSPVFVYITRLPRSGCLYLTDGTLLGCDKDEEAVLVRVTGVAPSVVYLPHLNAHSQIIGHNLATFSYCVSGTAIVDRRQKQCGDPAVVGISVRPVNDPPIATKVPPVTVQEGVEKFISPRYTVPYFTPKIPLLGTDSDRDDTIMQVEITEPPSHGYLILSVSVPRVDDLFHGTLLSDLNYTVLGPDPVYVKYIWDPTASDAIVEGNSVVDSFRFRVADREGIWSLEQSVQIFVETASAAKVKKEFVSVKYNSEVDLVWQGEDSSGSQRRIGYKIDFLPTSLVGNFYDTGTNSKLELGSSSSQTEAFPYTNGVRITFVPHRNFCDNYDSAQLLNNAKLRFSVVVFAKDSDIVVSVSEPQSQTIHIDCLIQTLSLTGPLAADTAPTLTLTRAANDNCLELDNILRTEACNAGAEIYGITVKTLNRTSDDVVFVSVFADPGYITFNRRDWHRTIGITGRRARQSNAIEFKSHPAALTDVFRGLYIQSLRRSEFPLTILLRYGDDCTQFEPITENSQPTATTTCQILRHDMDLRFDTPESDKKPKKNLIVPTPWPIFFCWFGYPLLYYLYTRLEIWYAESEIALRDLEIPTWTQYKNEDDGGFYYENRHTGEVTWKAPVGEEFVAWKDEEDVVEEENEDRRWIQHKSEEGEWYYENRETGDVTWDTPAVIDFVPWKEKEEEAENEEGPWFQHRNEDGEWYYENRLTGDVTWHAPVGEDFVPWNDDKNDTEIHRRPKRILQALMKRRKDDHQLD
jgi:hypothetical protein